MAGAKPTSRYLNKHQNKIYCMHSDKLLPPRTQTIGYTGQQFVALREFDLESKQIANVLIIYNSPDET
jgi:hypothetical protein